MDLSASTYHLDQNVQVFNTSRETYDLHQTYESNMGTLGYRSSRYIIGALTFNVTNSTGQILSVLGFNVKFGNKMIQERTDEGYFNIPKGNNFIDGI